MVELWLRREGRKLFLHNESCNAERWQIEGDGTRYNTEFGVGNKVISTIGENGSHWRSVREGKDIDGFATLLKRFCVDAYKD